jgi:hypothetical protein
MAPCHTSAKDEEIGTDMIFLVVVYLIRPFKAALTMIRHTIHLQFSPPPIPASGRSILTLVEEAEFVEGCGP